MKSWRQTNGKSRFNHRTAGKTRKSVQLQTAISHRKRRMTQKAEPGLYTMRSRVTENNSWGV